MTDNELHDPLTNCPVGGAIEILGDKWTLLILRDIALKGKRTHGELMRSKEGIATNILADRLERLSSSGVISRKTPPK
jgi:DNA-binding HxlR family transcriptional regulator